MSEVPAVRREVRVPTRPADAFALFTAHIGAWWPTTRHSVYGRGSLVAFEDGRLVERSAEGLACWAEVLEWNPPDSFRLSWHPGRDTAEATDVQVTFADISRGAPETLVTVIHSGWERIVDPTGSAEEYGNGWPRVLASFAAVVSARPGASTTDAEPGPADDGVRWYALVHTPGPALDEGESVFAHPRFHEHLAFLNRLRDRGVLVAAGPTVPEHGEGMTIVRLDPSVVGALDIGQLAMTDDKFVAAGYLEVDVRPWHVRLTGD
jgi:uncharacterized protein YciI